MTANDRLQEIGAALFELWPSYFGRVDVVAALAQSALETGFWSSPLVRNHSNAFGMRGPNTRPFESGATSSGFAIYPSLELSVKDYLERQKQFGIPGAGGDGSMTYGAAGDMTDAYIEATLNSGYMTPAEVPGYRELWYDIMQSMLDQGIGYGIDGEHAGTTNTATRDSSALWWLALLAAMEMR